MNYLSQPKPLTKGPKRYLSGPPGEQAVHSGPRPATAGVKLHAMALIACREGATPLMRRQLRSAALNFNPDVQL